MEEERSSSQQRGSQIWLEREDAKWKAMQGARIGERAAGDGGASGETGGFEVCCGTADRPSTVCASYLSRKS